MNLAAFGAAQLPLGLMLDRFGGRKTLVAMLSFALAGTFLFACAQSYVMLICARASSASASRRPHVRLQIVRALAAAGIPAARLSASKA